MIDLNVMDQVATELGLSTDSRDSLRAARLKLTITATDAVAVSRAYYAAYADLGWSL